MKFVHKATGVEVKVGDKVTCRNGGTMFVFGWQKPTSPASSGRINVVEHEGRSAEQRMILGQSYFPHVYDCEWVEREDREPMPPVIDGVIDFGPVKG